MLQATKCIVCGKGITTDGGGPQVCEACRQKYPPSLIKATYDEFDYALCFKQGQATVVVKFSKAEINGDWVYIRPLNPNHTPLNQDLPFPFERGLDIRLSDIIWCADAPNGS